MKTVDLRSDTVTQPTPAMREAMMAAPLGDDVFGDDPSVNALQDKIAAMTGKEAALFMASGTQSNLCAMLAHCERGDEYIVGQNAHTYRYEGGGAAVFGSIQPQPLAQDATGRWRWPTSPPPSSPTTRTSRARACCAWRTPGTATPCRPSTCDQATALAREHGLAVHLDGARVFNAAVAGGRRSVHRVARHRRPLRQRLGLLQQGPGRAGGLGAVWLARADRAARCAGARWLGGGLRQSGLLAAAAHHALDHHVDRLADDHALAQRLAAGPGRHRRPGVRSAQTNIVFVDVAERPRPRICWRILAHDGVLATGLIGLRFVTHLDVDAAGIDRAIASIRALLCAGRHGRQRAGPPAPRFTERGARPCPTCRNSCSSSRRAGCSTSRPAPMCSTS